MQTVNRDGGMYLTHTRLEDQFTLRMSIGQTGTQRRHVAKAWEQLQAAGRAAADN